MHEFRARNEPVVNAGGGVFNAIAGRGLQPGRGAPSAQHRGRRLAAPLRRALRRAAPHARPQVDDALVSDPSGVVRQFLPIVDRPHLERLVEGLESIQRIHRDIDEYGKLREMLVGVVEARKRYHDAALQHAGLTWLRAAWASDDAAQRSGRRMRRCARPSPRRGRPRPTKRPPTPRRGRPPRAGRAAAVASGRGGAGGGARQRDADAAQHEQERAARELRQAEERLQRSESSVASARQTLRLRRRAPARGSPSCAIVARMRWARCPTRSGGLEAGHRRAGRPAVGRRPAQRVGRDRRRACPRWRRMCSASIQATAHGNSRQESSATRAPSMRRRRAALQSARQALWARWDRMIQRWPGDMGRDARRASRARWRCRR